VKDVLDHLAGFLVLEYVVEDSKNGRLQTHVPNYGKAVVCSSFEQFEGIFEGWNF
jgi:hypothetical protein